MNDRAPASTRELLDFATEIAWEAGRLIMRHFQVGVGVTTKPDRTPVTEADIAGERLLRKRIEARFPGHRILGEEDGESGSDPTHRWILDPIDGTTSFIHGVPLFGMLIGLEIAGEAVVGVCNIAGLGEMVTGARGEGAFWNGRPARVSSVTEIQTRSPPPPTRRPSVPSGRRSAPGARCGGRGATPSATRWSAPDVPRSASIRR